MFFAADEISVSIRLSFSDRCFLEVLVLSSVRLVRADGSLAGEQLSAALWTMEDKMSDRIPLCCPSTGKYDTRLVASRKEIVDSALSLPLTLLSIVLVAKVFDHESKLD
jgi:hypothetical protein